MTTLQSLTDQILSDDDQLMQAIEGDEHDILREIIRALIGPGDPLDRYFAAEKILIRRAEHMAECELDSGEYVPASAIHWNWESE